MSALLVSIPVKGYYPQNQIVDIIVIAASDQQQISPENTAFSEQPEGFRLSDYRSPVPKSLTGATTLSTAELEALLDNYQASPPLLIDVLPKTKKPDWWPPGQIWLPEPHQSIPSAIWLPEIGFGTINEAVEAAYKPFIRSATDNNPNYPIVLFCRENCWISWNAAKRLLQYGYQSVYWYPDGIDGWLDNLNDTEVIKPKDLLAP
jgi:PQQ-dependent catabolism-associated CXXCW motif protein